MSLNQTDILSTDLTEYMVRDILKEAPSIKKVIGITTVIAEIANGPIHRPTKIVSTIMFNDMTKIPMEAGTACLMSRLLIESVPNVFDFRCLAIRQLPFWYQRCAIRLSIRPTSLRNHLYRLNKEWL